MSKNKERKPEDIEKERLAKELVVSGLDTEYWKTLVYNGKTYPQFEVSNLGRIRASCDKKILKQHKSGVPDYWYVILLKEYLGYSIPHVRINRCVSWTFHGEPPKGYTSDHINRNRYDNREVNLRWASRRKQMQNRDNTVLTSCGTPVVSFIRNLGYDPDASGSVGQYLCNKLRQGLSLSEAYFEWSNFLNPYPRPWKDRGNDRGIEYDNVWYPCMETFVKEKGNCTKETYLQRLQQGMSMKEALTFRYDYQELYRFEMDGFNMTTVEHCERLCISHQRVREYEKKRGLTFEEAVKIPVERVIKHNINGVTKRNTEWYEQFKIPARNANSWMKSKKRDGTSFNRSFRDVLEKYDVDTSDMTIYPCDGDVVMKNKPL